MWCSFSFFFLQVKGHGQGRSRKDIVSFEVHVYYSVPIFFTCVVLRVFFHCFCHSVFISVSIWCVMLVWCRLVFTHCCCSECFILQIVVHAVDSDTTVCWPQSTSVCLYQMRQREREREREWERRQERCSRWVIEPLHPLILYLTLLQCWHSYATPPTKAPSVPHAPHTDTHTHAQSAYTQGVAKHLCSVWERGDVI